MAKERKTLSDAVMQRFMTDPNGIQPTQPTTVDLSEIKLPKHPQPRRYFAPEKMAQLVSSVKEHGVLEPILVRPVSTGGYELIAGERRLRAAKEAGLTQIPIVSREFSDREALQVALMENLQREDLNPVEETEAILEFLSITLDTSVDDVKSLIYQATNAKNRGQELKKNVFLQLEKVESLLSEIGRLNLDSFRTSRLPLLNLPGDVLEVLRQGKIEYTKAQAIARIKGEEQRSALLEQAIVEGLSLNEIKSRIKEIKATPEATPEQVLVKQMTEITKRLRKPEAWSNRKKRDRIAKLLNELDQLTAEE